MAGISIGASQNSQIFNNSFYNCGYNNSYPGSGAIIRVPEPDNIATKNIDIFNNVVYNDSQHPFVQFFKDLAKDNPSGAIRHGYNTIYSEGVSPKWGYPNSADSSEEIKDPMFTNPSAGNLTLLEGSPAINSGKSLGRVLFDFNMNQRPIGDKYDRGAYEK